MWYLGHDLCPLYSLHLGDWESLLYRHTSSSTIKNKVFTPVLLREECGSVKVHGIWYATLVEPACKIVKVLYLTLLISQLCSLCLSHTLSLLLLCIRQRYVPPPYKSEFLSVLLHSQCSHTDQLQKVKENNVSLFKIKLFLTKQLMSVNHSFQKGSKLFATCTIDITVCVMPHQKTLKRPS